MDTRTLGWALALTIAACSGRTQPLHAEADGSATGSSSADGGVAAEGFAPAGTLSVSRVGLSATFIPAGGHVLIAGGATIQDDMLAYTRLLERFDPAARTLTVAGELTADGARAFHTATLLLDGRVLLAGGEGLAGGQRGSLRSALIVDARDPQDVAILDGPALELDRTEHTAVRLADGRVVIAGGRTLDSTRTDAHLKSVELFDPATAEFSTPITSLGSPLELAHARSLHSATLLTSGQDILIAGGMNEHGADPTFEILHFGSDGISATLPRAMLGAGPIAHAAALIPNGEVIISGGYARAEDARPSTGLPQHPSAVVEIWRIESTGELTRACSGRLAEARGYHTLSMLGAHSLVIGGAGGAGVALDSAELGRPIPSDACFDRAPTLKPMTVAHRGHAVAEISPREVVVAGGLTKGTSDAFGRTVGAIEVFTTGE
jgi:galactose oxidase-like protein